MSLKQVKFTKNQIAVLEQMFKNANSKYTGDYAYFYGYVESFVEQLSENHFAYLEG